MLKKHFFRNLTARRSNVFVRQLSVCLSVCLSVRLWTANLFEPMIGHPVGEKVTWVYFSWDMLIEIFAKFIFYHHVTFLSLKKWCVQGWNLSKCHSFFFVCEAVNMLNLNWMISLQNLKGRCDFWCFDQYRVQAMFKFIINLHLLKFKIKIYKIQKVWFSKNL